VSRSFKHHPFCGITTCDSEKDDKRLAHRVYRHAIRQQLLAARYPLDPPLDALPEAPEAPEAPDESYAEIAELLPHWREYSDPWAWGKDGRWRFDPTRYPALLRK
jgi:hypothetical protein